MNFGELEFCEYESDFVRLYKGIIKSLNFAITGLNVEPGVFVMTHNDCHEFVNALAKESGQTLTDPILFVKQIDEDWQEVWVDQSKALHDWIGKREAITYFYQSVEVVL